MKTDVLAFLACIAIAIAILAALANVVPTNSRPCFGEDSDGIHRWHSGK